MTPLQERAKKLVDDLAASRDPRTTSSAELGRLIGMEAERVAPGDKKFFMAVVAYMQHLAAQSCGPSADHKDCQWQGGRTEHQ